MKKNLYVVKQISVTGEDRKETMSHKELCSGGSLFEIAKILSKDFPLLNFKNTKGSEFIGVDEKGNSYRFFISTGPDSSELWVEDREVVKMVEMI